MDAKYPHIPKELDGRRKLSDEDREDIRKLYASGDFSYNQIARDYGVSKRLIIFICNPESKKREYARRRERIARGEYQQYNPDKTPEYMRRHRAKQRKINGEAFTAYERRIREASRKRKKNER